jgi:hypothetical protein
MNKAQTNSFKKLNYSVLYEAPNSGIILLEAPDGAKATMNTRGKITVCKRYRD